MKFDNFTRQELDYMGVVFITLVLLASIVGSDLMMIFEAVIIAYIIAVEPSFSVAKNLIVSKIQQITSKVWK